MTTQSQPSIGELHQPFFGPQCQDPAPFYAHARHAEPVFRSPALNMWVITRYDDVVRVLRDPATFSSRDALGVRPPAAPEAEAIMATLTPINHLLNADPPYHERLRDALNLAFTPSAVGAMEPSIRRIASELIDAFCARGHADLVADFALPLPLTVIFELFGIKREHMHQAHLWSVDLVQLAFGMPMTVERQVECAHSFVAMERFCRELAESRMRNPGDDLISRVLHPADPDVAALTVDEVIGQLPGFILAGHETTANLIGNLTRALLAEPAQWQRVTSDARLRARAVEEALRYDGSILGMLRTATADVELGGAQLRAGDVMFLAFHSANRDETRFECPDEFRVERAKQGAHIGFGRGIHYCIGAPLARLEVAIALELMGSRLPGLRLVEGQSFARRQAFPGRGFEQLDIEWDVD